jgi:hypothetical protein
MSRSGRRSVARPRLAQATVGSLVRAAVRNRGLSRSELDRLVRRFIAAGRRAIQAELGTARQAAEVINATDDVRAQARDTLARRTKPGHPSVLVAPDWQRPARALSAHKRQLLRYPGVVGYGLDANQPQVSVLMSSELTDTEARSLKRRPPPASLPGGAGGRVPVEVIPVSRLRRQFVAGSSLGPAGRPTKGTLGTFAFEQAGGAAVALTAMHVAKGPGRFVIPSLRDDPMGLPLGRFLAGTMVDVDAAMISVDPPAQAEPFLPGIGRIRGWRPVTLPGDRGTEVRMFGAESGRQRGFIAEPAIELPGEGLAQVILVDIETREGDSGCAIVDSENLVLGLLVGEMDFDGLTLRVFSPISLVLDALQCEIPSLGR